jgi:GNAT superfamily N-acetyltransferase
VQEQMLKIRRLHASDIPVADEIRSREGWNQTVTDWTRLIEHQRDGCFAAILENQLVGAVSTTVHNGEVAWIGMMLVHRDFRRQGIGRRLMQAALDYLDALNVPCIKLDATPAGRPVYLKLGFREESSLNRWSRETAVTPWPNAAAPSPEGAETWNTIASSDQLAFGANRLAWCQALAKDSHVVKLVGDNSDVDGDCGVGMLRRGDRVPYIGPIVSNSERLGCQIGEQLASLVGGAYWDIPTQNQAARATAHSLGFAPVRELYRMWRGTRVQERPEMQFAITAPETG